MKVVEIRGVKYYIQSKDDMISFIHELTEKGYNIKQIAQFLDISEKQVKKYLEDCW